jgi:DNA-binding beta-propeller fold protein YncE
MMRYNSSKSEKKKFSVKRLSFSVAIAAVLLASSVVVIAYQQGLLTTRMESTAGNAPFLVIMNTKGGTDRDLILVRAVQPFDELKVFPNVTKGSTTLQVYPTSDGRYLYLGSGQQPWLYKLDTVSLTLTRIYTAGDNSQFFTFTPDGKFIYVYGDNSDIETRRMLYLNQSYFNDFVEGSGLVTKIDASTGAIVDVIKLDAKVFSAGEWEYVYNGPGGVSGIMMSPDNYLYIPIEFPLKGENATVWKIDTRSDKVVAVIDLGHSPGSQMKGDLSPGSHMDGGMRPDGRYLFLTGGGVGIYVIDTRENRVVKVISNEEIGGETHCIHMQPDGKRFWVPANSINGTYWAVFDVETLKKVAMLGPVPDLAHWAEFTPDGRYAVTDSTISDQIQIWSVEDLQLVKRIDTGYAAIGERPQPGLNSWHPLLSPDARFVYVPNLSME